MVSLFYYYAKLLRILDCCHLDYKPTLLLFSALSVPQFRSIKLRSRKPTCPACGQQGKIIGSISDIDYVQFCGGATPDWETLGLVETHPMHRIRVKVELCIILISKCSAIP